ncbi:hypothetical protein J31TS4_08640 [Paenibacillus sp. J31TS4]|uniref:hypothetical protein n=1 Tax=Paenibacillus sp. J31TS4 TaxID=2807195 RepID=UPI001B1E9845|nr:hypothetical protein [Paenibacillus sp. J31TS4]GIP37584.1 hypothetical protein J31TS4_08640 [Paenibacillus sp. J31TS4]
METWKSGSNAVWLYLGKEEWTEERIAGLTTWCREQRVKRVIVYITIVPYPDEAALRRLQTVADACREAGLEAHGMVSTLQQRTEHPGNLPFADRDAYGVDAHGISTWDEPLQGKGYFLDPTSPEVADWLAGTLGRLLRDLPALSGIHLDFIRYYYYESELRIDTKNAGHWLYQPQPGQTLRIGVPDGSETTFFVASKTNAYNDPPIGRELVLRRSFRYCYCSRCIRSFEEASGVRLPAGLETAERAAWIDEHAASAWSAFRAEAVTSVVRQIRSELRTGHPGKQLSAAVWYNAPYGNELREEPLTPDSEIDRFGQDWAAWAREGLLDFVCPMDYWLTPASFGSIVAKQTAKAGGAIPVYAGLLTSGDYPFDAERLESYRAEALASGAEGLCFFHYGAWSQIL